MPPTYEDFTLILDGSAGQYTVAAQGPGQIRVAPVACALQETDRFRAAIANLEQGSALARTDMEALGTQLFEALFPRPIFRAFERARSVVPPGTALRLKLVIRSAALSYLPWELMYDPDDAVFLAARLSFPIVRSIENGTPVAGMLARHPLRVLYVQANPGDTQRLDLRASEQALRDGLGAAGDVTAIYAATPEMLRDTLRASPGFHVLHYDGHAEFDLVDDAGEISLHDSGGRTYSLILQSHLIK